MPEWITPEYTIPSNEDILKAFISYYRTTPNFKRLAQMYKDIGKDPEDIFLFKDYQVGLAYQMFFNGFHEGYKLSNMERLKQ